MTLPRWISKLLSRLSMGLLFASAGAAAQNPLHPESLKYRTHFVAFDVQKKTATTIFTIEGEWHSPNWSADGMHIVSDMGGGLYRIPVSGANRGKPERIDVGQNRLLTNDHALSWDGKQIAVTAIALPLPAKMRSIADIHNPIFIVNMDGSGAREVHRGWLHGWSPDSKDLVYAQYPEDNPNTSNIYRVGADGSGELQMTADKALDDGPEYSGDGKWVYFCSNRSGKWDGWRMPADGAGPNSRLAERITKSRDTQDWFPHISPDGQWLYTISFPMEHPEHTYIGEGMKIKLLRLKNGEVAKGAELTTVRTFYGGQGSGNTGGWATDSKKFVWTEYEAIPQPGQK